MAGLLARTALPSSSRIDLVTRRCRQSGTDKRKTATDYTGQRRAIGYCDQTTAAYRRGGEREERLNPRDAAEFAAGSLETELSAIGKAVPTREWAKVPADCFANLDHYLHGAPKKK
jgi:hypothetical protein